MAAALPSDFGLILLKICEWNPGNNFISYVFHIPADVEFVTMEIIPRVPFENKQRTDRNGRHLCGTLYWIAKSKIYLKESKQNIILLIMNRREKRFSTLFSKFQIKNFIQGSFEKLLQVHKHLKTKRVETSDFAFKSNVWVFVAVFFFDSYKNEFGSYDLHYNNCLTSEDCIAVKLI